MRIFVDMDGTLAKWNNVEFEQLFEEGYYRNLAPNVELLNEVNSLIRQGEDVYILSAYLTESEYAKKEKQEWVKQYLPELIEEKQIFVPYGTNKAEYLKEHYSPITNDDYLIDDYTKNLLEWKEYGGIGVKYLNGINHTRGTWQGLRIYEKTTKYNNTGLLNFVLSEKMKAEGITLIASYDGAGPGDMSYECIYDNKYYDLQGLFWRVNNPNKLTLNEIKNRICNELKENSIEDYLVNLLSKESLISNYYYRHYPTLSRCRDFRDLISELSTDTLDDIEYTLYLYENTNAVSLELDGVYYSKDYEFLKNNSRFNIMYIKWHEGMIDTKDLISEIHSVEINKTSFSSITNEEPEEPDICG